MAPLKIVSTALLIAASAGAAGSTSPAPAAAGPHRNEALPAAPAPAVEGSWTATDLRAEGMQLRLHREISMWGSLLPRAELEGLSDAQIASPTSTPVSFRIGGETGVFEMNGTFREGKGAGLFRFLPERAFARTLASMGIAGAEQATDHDLMLLALGRVSAADVREFTALELGALAVSDLVALGVHHVTPEYVRSMRSLGLAETNTVSRLVKLRVHRITADFVREMEAAGYRDLPREQLLRMGIHGVSAEQVRELEGAGYRNLSSRQLTDMRIHRVTPAFIREMREAGFRDLTPEALVRLRLHRITGEYVRELRALGYGDVPHEQLLRMGIHRVTPAFIRATREAGAGVLSPEALVRMKIRGIDPALVGGRNRRGR